jgi:4-diphosphocytidyl-2-C-methyl-D-erythritol kinase
VDKLRILAPAKVNLILEVLGKRRDGYHEVRTLIQQISLCDEITVSSKGRGIQVDCDTVDIPGDERNIVWRAADLFLERSGKSQGVGISIRKRIPVAAGLGGGSSDAASTLIGLNRLLGLNRSKEELMEWGACLGADVPFFIFGSPALAFGIGDRLQTATFGFPLWYVLVSLPLEVSTAWVYGKLNLRLTNSKKRSKIPSFFHELDGLLNLIHNDLETVTEITYPQISQVKRALLDNGARRVLMTGSGPVVFGLFPDERSARYTYDQIRSDFGWNSFLAKGIVS